MHDAGRILAGLVIFFVLVGSPIWYNLASGKASYRPEPKIVTEEKECVQSKEYMTVAHMNLLNEWRDAVVREGVRVHVAPNDKKHVMSLSRTCLGCHSNKAEFCDSCHNYMGVTPYCWNCHIVPKETE